MPYSTINQENLLAIAADWSYWTKAPAPSVKRAVDLPKALRPDLALVIQGVRRCGKSTLLTQLIRRYRLKRRDCLFINFEDPRLSQHLSFELLQDLVDVFEGERDGPCTFFFDEIQHVQGWQRWLRSMLDRPTERRFVVTGSNAHLLSGELGSSLIGRHLVAELFPFSFEEFGLGQNEANLQNYLQAGGFPAALDNPDGDRLLRTYFSDIVERDVRERVGARSTGPLRQVVQMLYESAGSELSVRRVAAAAGIAVDTASLYIDAAESAYLAFACPFFAYSERKRVARNRKFYPVDTGLAANLCDSNRERPREDARVCHLSSFAQAVRSRLVLAR